jgi:hypothetical protein
MIGGLMDKEIDVPSIRAAVISIATKDIEAAKDIDTAIGFVEGTRGMVKLGEKISAGEKISKLEKITTIGDYAMSLSETMTPKPIVNTSGSSVSNASSGGTLSGGSRGTPSSSTGMVSNLVTKPTSPLSN